MQALKIILGVLVVLILAFVGIGLMSSRRVLANEVELAEPIDEVWNAFTDESRMGEWMEGLQRTENISGDPLTVGSRWKLVFVEGDKEMEVIEEVTACRPNEVYSFKVETDPFVGTTEIRFTPSENGTKLVSTSTMEGRNLIWCGLLGLMKGTIAERNQASFDNLKRMIEASPQPDEAVGE